MASQSDRRRDRWEYLEIINNSVMGGLPRVGRLDNLSGMKVLVSLLFLIIPGMSASAVETAPAAWPRYHAKVAKDQVNFRVEPSIRARLAPVRPPKGEQLSVQRSSDDYWFEILDPEEYRGFFVRKDLVILGAKESVGG